MTREEAKRNLIHAIRWNDMPKKEALDMAIKALEQKYCEDAISRQAVLEYIEASDAELGHSSENEFVCQDIKELPPVTPQPKTGHWIEDEKQIHVERTYHCSECGGMAFGSERSNYCPDCGSEMKGEGQMTLDEAIIHAQEVAHNNTIRMKRYDDASGYTRSRNEAIRTQDAKRCEKCAEDHRQLAEWLRELKNLKERSISDDAIDREDALMALTGEWTVSKDELIAKFVRRVKKLPPVRPKDDRQEVIDRIRKLQKYRFSKDDDVMVNLDDVIAILEGREPE